MTTKEQNIKNKVILIVGQGLAGTILGLTCQKLGLNYHIMTDPHTAACSRVAAGLINPLTGNRIVRTWRARQLFPFLKSFYREAEKTLEATFFHPLSIYRPFKNIAEQNDWARLSKTAKFNSFVKQYHNQSTYGHYLNDDFGGLEIDGGGWLNIPVFLDAAKAFFQKNGRYTEASVCYDAIKKAQKHYAQVVLACGQHIDRLFGFQPSPFHLSKGEILTVKSEVRLDIILNRGVFCIPLGDGLFRIGATYDHCFSNEKITNEKREELVKKAQNLLKFDFDIVDHLAGIRPSTKDKKPMIGRPKKASNLAVFSGLGSKGVSLAPLLASNWLKHDIGFGIGDGFNDPEVDTNRFIFCNLDSNYV